jgi:hydroxyacylglutathione hydrolase
MYDYQVTCLAAFTDNYLWLLSRENSAILIDPGDADVCIKALSDRNLQLDFILATHHHNDHIGGIKKLVDTFNCPVYGPYDQRIPEVTDLLTEGSVVYWKNNAFQVFHLPGHTQTHIVYWNSDKHQLFCGDVLFSAGCGRIKEGEAADLYHSLQRLAQLPRDTEIFCAHEYTLSNLNFAMHLEPDNKALQDRYHQVKQLRVEGSPSIPTRLDIELATNPFLRSFLPGIRQKLDTIASQPQIQSALSQFKINSTDEYYFAVMRLWKNIYV